MNLSDIRPGCIILNCVFVESVPMLILDVAELRDNLYSLDYLRLFYISEDGEIRRRYVYPGDANRYKLLLPSL